LNSGSWMFIHHKTLSSPLVTNLEPKEEEDYRLVSRDLIGKTKFVLSFFLLKILGMYFFSSFKLVSLRWKVFYGTRVENSKKYNKFIFERYKTLLQGDQTYLPFWLQKKVQYHGRGIYSNCWYKYLQKVLEVKLNTPGLWFPVWIIHSKYIK